MDALIIYDFDGVVADSEVLANAVLAEFVTALGVPTSLQDSYRLYMGKRFVDVIDAVAESLGRPVPETFASDYQTRTLARFRENLKLVEGVRRYIDTFEHVPRCIASSSSPDRLALCLEVVGLQSHFGACVFSASNVTRGKPHPDIFVYAAEQMGVPPSNCVVLEDSPSGVQAAIAADMTVIGILAASHIQPDHSERLRAAGAHYISHTFVEAEHLTRKWLAKMQDEADCHVVVAGTATGRQCDLVRPHSRSIVPLLSSPFR
jgi:HAD superfamily hydrolase (TIGR01509 family)